MNADYLLTGIVAIASALIIYEHCDTVTRADRVVVGLSIAMGTLAIILLIVGVLSDG